MGDDTCCEGSCGKPLFQRGYCENHYRRKLRSGELPKLKNRQRLICSVLECEGPSRARGWCDAHWQRWRKYGDPLATVQRDSTEDRFFAKVADGPGECWTWTGAVNEKGYGCFNASTRTVRAHRWSYEFLVAEIPDGLTLDHLCRNTSCVNPYHAEPVPAGVNTLRGDAVSAVNARKTECIRGHKLSGADVSIEASGARRCLACKRIRRREAKRAAMEAA